MQYRFYLYDIKIIEVLIQLYVVIFVKISENVQNCPVLLFFDVMENTV